MIGEPVDIITPGTRTDGYGNTLPSWDDATTVTVEGAAFAPTGSVNAASGGSEDVTLRDAVSDAPMLYLPPDTPITATCRVVARGLTYEVVGDPADWRNPYSGTKAGLAVGLKRVEG